MGKRLAHDLVGMARQAGYQVVTIEQLRSNRWLLTLHDPTAGTVMLLVQSRALVSASDVQDLAELMRLRQPQRAILLAYTGTFTVAARQTATELADERVHLCTTLPAACQIQRSAEPQPQTISPGPAEANCSPPGDSAQPTLSSSIMH